MGKNKTDPKIRRGRIGSIDVYDVTDDELTQLEQGGPDSVYLNIAIALIFLGIPTALSMLVIDRSKILPLAIYIVVTVFSFGIGVILLIIWVPKRKNNSKVIQKIRDRMQESTAAIEKAGVAEDPTATM